MSSAPAAGRDVSPGLISPNAGQGLRQPVLALLLVLWLLSLAGLPFLTEAPNRLIAGQGVALWALVSLNSAAWWALAMPLAVLAFAVVRPVQRPRPQLRAWDAACALSAAGLLAAMVALAGTEAARRAALLPPMARVSLGGGFWLGALWIWAAAADAVQRLTRRPAARMLAHAAVLLAPALLLGIGALDALSLMKEYANRREVFHAAVWRHVQIVGLTLVPAMLIGLPLGVAAARRPGLARPVFALLNAVQTVPSIALFGLLIGPLAWLGQAVPGWGVQGIGLVPAVLALTLYALLPLVHGMAAGLQQVSPAVRDAAAGMGLSQRQRFWRVELPLAWPVLCAALRLTTVQLVGLAVVAALIGAGGLGALVFQGLSSSALDLVLLGVVPVVALALAVDAVFRLLEADSTSALTGPQP